MVGRYNLKYSLSIRVPNGFLSLIGILQFQLIPPERKDSAV